MKESALTREHNPTRSVPVRFRSHVTSRHLFDAAFPSADFHRRYTREGFPQKVQKLRVCARGIR